MLIKDGHYKVDKKVHFSPLAKILQRDDILQSIAFALNMAYGEGEHRKNRTGGTLKRPDIEIFTNTLQGKISEFVTKRFLESEGIECGNIDLSVYGTGAWDEEDIKVGEYSISVKSMAHFSNLLLLETQDWNEQGGYIPNHGKTYDFFVLVRVKPDLKTWNKKYLIELCSGLRSKPSEINNVAHNICEALLPELEYDIPGCLSLNGLKTIIARRKIIPKGAILNGRIRMDAENFYAEVGSLKKHTEKLIAALSR